MWRLKGKTKGLSWVCGWAIDYNITIFWVCVWFWVCGWVRFVLSNQVLLQYSFMIFLWLSWVCGWAGFVLSNQVLLQYSFMIFLWLSWVCGWAGFVLSNHVLLQYSFMILLCLISGFVWFFLFCALVCSAILGFWIPSFLFVFVFFVFLNLSLCLVLGLFLCSYCF